MARPAAMRPEDSCHSELLACDVLVCAVAWNCLLSFFSAGTEPSLLVCGCSVFSHCSKCLWTGGLPLRGVIVFQIVQKPLEAGLTTVSSEAGTSARPEDVYHSEVLLYDSLPCSVT